MVFDSGLVNVNWTTPLTMGRSRTPHHFHSPDPPTRVGRGRLAVDMTQGIPQASFQVVDDAAACSSSGLPGQLLNPYLYHATREDGENEAKIQQRHYMDYRDLPCIESGPWN